MILAAAQTSPTRFDINANLADHYRFIELAAKNNADLVLFPELSISGYEREKAAELAFEPNDSRLSEIRKLAVKNKIVIIAGAPIRMNKELYIGAFVFQPDDTVSVYTKQFLHTGEEVYYHSSFDFNQVLELKNEQLTIAICADINHPGHAEQAKKLNTSIYLASIFWEPQDMARAYQTLSAYAKNHSMNVLMSNFTGQSWGLDVGGESGFWDKTGDLVANLNSSESGLLLIEKEGDNWAGKKIKF
ncbi:carbon-nitrogen hydrolase family protein [Maribellus sediminis]|uniref:carbon-nitrogen hydrolase family protein n=1 Tax=Maribellus sediminis TaxID=2696285 RepID=UPI001431810A|nr:carbon-nitrogen hydrolase family protein [Maribellus sediminis]